MKFCRILKLFSRVLRSRKKIIKKSNDFQTKIISFALSSHFIIAFNHFPAANPKHMFILLNLLLVQEEFILRMRSKMRIRMKGKKVIAMAVKRDNRQKMKTNKYQKK